MRCGIRVRFYRCLVSLPSCGSSARLISRSQRTTAHRPPGLPSQIAHSSPRSANPHRTEDAYCHWIRRSIVFHGTSHPAQLGATEIESFLSCLATDRDVSASTPNQALCALLFLYRAVLTLALPPLANIARVRTPPRLPAGLDRSEVRAVSSRLSGVPWLVASCCTAPACV